MKCGKVCEVYSRVVGYHRPIQNWNKGKRAEFSERTEFSESISLSNERVSMPVENAQPILVKNCC